MTTTTLQCLQLLLYPSTGCLFVYHVQRQINCHKMYSVLRPNVNQMYVHHLRTWFCKNSKPMWLYTNCINPWQTNHKFKTSQLCKFTCRNVLLHNRIKIPTYMLKINCNIAVYKIAPSRPPRAHVTITELPTQHPTLPFTITDLRVYSYIIYSSNYNVLTTQF